MDVMPADWIPIFVQAPVVAIFAVFVLYIQKQWTKSLEELSKDIRALTATVEKFNGANIVSDRLIAELREQRATMRRVARARGKEEE